MMLRSLLSLSFVLALAGAILAQQPTLAQRPQPQPGVRDLAPAPSPAPMPVPPSVDTHTSLGNLAPTEAMWFYERAIERRDSPKQAVRRRAEFAAQQRQYRLEAQRWFGYSASRPIANPTPLTSSYSPSWVGNSDDPFAWRGTAATPIVVAPSISPVGMIYGLW